ncbi:molybdenum cofactor guanylyltransferase MobA [Rhizobium puerariae]|uniref:Molybdenum cofactor guanylyltransferase n=1 Tax=Rhizobium puerariae TaxID=1585791 RepID=A0ABV6APT2_9HYPH
MATIHRPPGLILAGGRSSRMGAIKAFLDIGGVTILSHIVRRLAPQVSAITLNAPEDFPNPLGFGLLPDRIGNHIGPLAGVLSGLRDIEARGAAATHLLTVPSDSPFVPADLAERLRAATDNPDAVVIAASDGRSHPVFGLWPVSVADDLEAWLGDPDNRRIKAFLRRHPMVTVEFPLIDTARGPLDPFFNINTPEDLEEARNFAKELA